jgi:hypothetical protein
MTWSAERVMTLAERWSAGATASAIANELGGVTRSAVLGKVHREGLTRNPTISVALPVPMAEPIRPRRKRSGKFDREQIRAAYGQAKAKGLSNWSAAVEAAHLVGCVPQTIRNVMLAKDAAGQKTDARYSSRSLEGSTARMPAFDNPALMEGRTVYPHTIISNTRGTRALKSGVNTAKIGGRILKGKWEGFPVYTLTLEERATCPKTCRHWRSCYGNKMNWAERMQAGPDLEWRLEREVAALELDHQGGFAVRLHSLGDFYSVEYVDIWRRLLDKHAALHCFGYSARWQVASDPIAAALVRLFCERWDRFAIRFSDAPMEEISTASIEHPYQKPEDAVICPEQMGQTESCSTCGLCWQTRKRIAFIHH